jgi:hypothetical protein
MEWFIIGVVYCAICWLVAIVLFSLSVKDDNKMDEIDIISTVFAPIAFPLFILYMIWAMIFND